MHTALETVFEMPLATSAGMNLRLDYKFGSVELAGGICGLLRRGCNLPLRTWD